MLFPKNRVRFTTTYNGKDDAEGWIVLDLKGIDLEGASKIYLPAADLHRLQEAGDTTTNRLKQARMLLGGDGLDTEDAGLEETGREQ